MAKPRASPDDSASGAKGRIMRAAEKLVAERGYAATPVAQIAQEARANRALLYYYFRDKRDLYRAIIERGLVEVLRLLEEADQAPGDSWQRLERFVRSYYELLVSRRDVVRIVFREATGGEKHLGLPVRKYLRESHARVRRIIEQGLGNGEFHAVDPELTALSLFGMIHVFFTQRLTTGRGLSADVVVAHTLQLLRHGAGAPPGRAAHSRRRNAKRQT